MASLCAVRQGGAARANPPQHYAPGRAGRNLPEQWIKEGTHAFALDAHF